MVDRKAANKRAALNMSEVLENIREVMPRDSKTCC